LTYTTNRLESDLSVIGHPLVHLWLETTAPDLDVFVYLEEVDAMGLSTYITEGTLRASHRLAMDAPYNGLGLPFYRHYESDLQLIPADEPIELNIDMLPSAWLFHPGSRIRVTVTFADADTFDTPIIDPAPEVLLLRDIDHPSYIELP